MPRPPQQDRFLTLLEEHKKILYKVAHSNGPSLKVQRVRATMWTLLAAPLLWILVLIVALKGLIGLDAYAVFDGAWLAANVLFGVAVIPLAVWISRRQADRMDRSPFVQSLLRDIAGYNLNAAMGFLGSLEQFEEEERPAIG